MKTVGQILKENREAKFYTLDEVEKNTKIRKELLQALEENNFDKLPPPTFIQGFIKNYGNFLGLDSQKLLAVFRRDFEAKKHPPKVLESFSHPLKERKFRVTPSKVIALVVGLIVLSFFIYLWVEYRPLIGPPPLVVTSPVDSESFDVPTITVEGKTDPEVNVFVNNQEIGVDKDGHFKEEIKLSSSTEKIIITATSKFKQTAKIERTVFVKK